MKTNYIARHWRGELSLRVAFWINGIVAGAITGSVQGQAAQLKKDFQSKLAQQQKDFQATAGHQQKQIKALTAGLQKVTAQVRMSRPAPQMVLND